MIEKAPIISDIIEWDVWNWSNVLPFWEESTRGLDAGKCRVLCLGERNGGISLWFALKGFSVVCSDYRGPREDARLMHMRYGVTDRITYADVNIFTIPFEDETFDIVACKSVIGGLKLKYSDPSTRTLANQHTAVNEIRRVLKPGGYFLGAENMRGSWFHQALRRLTKGDKIGWRHLTVREEQWLFESFAEVTIKYFGFLGSHYSRLINVLSSRADVLLSALLPNTWLYISFIRCRK